MNEKDDIILEYLDDVGVAEPPAVIHFNISRTEEVDFVEKTTKRRLKRLLGLGLVTLAYEKGRYYEITDEGRAYLAGDLDASELDG
ncbi:hypothetical protein [Halorubrum tropicale]|nr:hypothetical protein [Halorubrum tropicale]